MSICTILQKERLAQFRPPFPIFDECRRINHGQGELINTSWVSRSIRSALNTGNCDGIDCVMVPVRNLIKSMGPDEVDKYRIYAAQLSLYDCKEPLIAIRKGRRGAMAFDPETCEILNGKARAVCAETADISLPVIVISKARARFWGMPLWAQRLGTAEKSIRLTEKKHRCRSGFVTLPQRPVIDTEGKLVQPSKEIVSVRLKEARVSTAHGRVAHPNACGLVLSNDGSLRSSAHKLLTVRNLKHQGLIDSFPELKKSGPSTPRYQETCLLILFAKVLKALRDNLRLSPGKWYDDLRLLCDWAGTESLRRVMRDLLRLPVDKEALKCPYQKELITEAFREYASDARAALASAGTAWNSSLSERLLLFSATRDPESVNKSEKKDALLRRHYLELLDWTLRALFRAKHWRIGCNSIERFDTHGNFHKPDPDDRTSERRPVQRVEHEALGSPRFQALTDLDLEQLLILAMHARFNPFLIWHDMRWAVPLGHWAMAIADLDAGRPTHVAVWMAELYEEQRRRNFEHRNHFTGPATMILHWLHWACGDVADFSQRMHEVCDQVINGFPHRSGRLIEIRVDDAGKRRLDSETLKYQEDWALQATLFA